MEQNEDSPLVNNPRDALRGSVIRALISISENSKFFIILKLLLGIFQLVACAYIIAHYETSTDKPLLTFVYLIISVDAAEIICLFYFVSTNPAERSETPRNLFGILKNLSSL